MSTQGQTQSEQAISQIVSDLRNLVDDLSVTSEVITLLLPNGRPHEFESQLWDYKEVLPVRPSGTNEVQLRNHKAELGQIIKDAVAFHNAYGGYIIFGVASRGKDRIKGIVGEFDVGDLNKVLHSYTGTNVECIYRTHEIPGGGAQRTVGLLLIPRRAAGGLPVAFKRKGPDNARGERCFTEGTYVRVRDECRPATATSEDWQFLHSNRHPPHSESKNRRLIRHGLPARDPELIEFVGREETLKALRTWLEDDRSPVRLLSGIGGLGKTTLAYRFVEDVVAANPQNIEWLIWLRQNSRLTRRYGAN